MLQLYRNIEDYFNSILANMFVPFVSINIIIIIVMIIIISSSSSSSSISMIVITIIIVMIIMIVMNVIGIISSTTIVITAGRRAKALRAFAKAMKDLLACAEEEGKANIAL